MAMDETRPQRVAQNGHTAHTQSLDELLTGLVAIMPHETRP